MNQQTSKPERPSYKKTLNPRNTSFAMRANLVQREPEFQKRWDRLGVYKLLREQREGRPRFVLHDGPPYANGSIHLGHLLNKVLKDLVVRSRNMLGYDAPFIPGWDCHGLPIEHKVMQELGDKARDMVAPQIRKRCQDYAAKFIKLQSKQMQRLGTMGDYDAPYLTMDPNYEAATLEVFADLVGKGLVTRSLKPVHWSIENQTALADAELEYYDREDTSVYVLFEIDNPQDLPASLNARPGEPLSLTIWTTTPWTLPANLAVAVAPSAEYGLYRWDGGERGGLTLVACDLAEKVFEMAGAYGDLLGTCTGAELEAAKITYRHPFVDRTSPVVTADYVTLEDGTGLVHTAPGHGVEDYQTGLRIGLDIYCPVLEDGTMDDTVPDWLRGKSVWEANDLVTEHLRESGHLLHDLKFLHSYPHDWRSKTPVIFRATEQWFIKVDDEATSLRDLGLEVTKEQVRFIPEWGRNRMRGMLDSRPDWCISRQRAWGLPIPAFLGSQRGQVLLTEKSVQAVADKVRRHGSDYWFTATAQELLADYDPGDDPDAPEWLKDTNELAKANDIFDVWFESGSSWNAVIRQRFGADHVPVDLYLEGSDQHRGWFQLSLLPALGVTGGAPFKSVLTHGFMVDKHGKKMSKSVGKTIMVDQLRTNLEADDGLLKEMTVDDWLRRLGVINGGDAQTHPQFVESTDVLEHYSHDPDLDQIIDADGIRKLLSNSIEVDDLMTKFGADVARWWVASLNYENDIKVDWHFFNNAGEEYRKVRNTIRFLLMNLDDFDNARDRRELGEADAASVDAWAIGELATLIETVRKAYEGYQFRRVHEAVFNFCNDAMSAVYLAATKDRLYCDKPDSDHRRRTQTAMHDIAEALIRLIAPVLVHTADEAWLALHGADPKADDCVHLHELPEAIESPASDAWDDAMALRDRAMKVLEDARQKLDIDNPLDAGVTVALPADQRERLAPFAADLPDLCGVSRFSIAEGDVETITIDDLRDEPRCDRSWKRDGTVKERTDGGMLSDRDAEAVGVE